MTYLSVYIFLYRFIKTRPCRTQVTSYSLVLYPV